ncbi:metalloregulator ArsR/SmtB family transcription factor [Rhizobium pusense]|uniref:ArsR/SmtB family transcription factor n=1 Tax=Alphaproteobacteria TaxID=28211 RepID=UPI0002D50C87|nr:MULTISPECIES: metalloregulator ArsR/SmtB family transcription factor [Hyphomicrobiales]MBA4784172.1 winged helix-turn-helix transcriptional regulator [Hyphomicrobiales bacterium]EXL02244.1 ArsR family transcriptional regulator [Brucella anthropi]KAB2756196.1 winged helix-turn-helix transcriptional regulator [Brucella anthropi]KAB2794708.1 winged helix-turn-helix transcriptional regulator [Brucella anthropi]KRA68988.1 ArsR family transcriptional regulator [Rhizobium sp. Root651]
MNKADPLSTQELNFLSETFRLLGDPSRLRILLHCEEGPKSVTDISETLELSQSLVSHHLRLLRGARLVTRVRHSKQMFYEISDQHVGDVLLDMLSHVREEREGVAERDASVQHS